jgi:hypothetical protein
MLWKRGGALRTSESFISSPQRDGCSEAQKWQYGLPRMKHRQQSSTPQNGLADDRIRTWQTLPYTISPTTTHIEAEVFETIASAELVFPDEQFDEFGRSISSSFAVSSFAESVKNDHCTSQVSSFHVRSDKKLARGLRQSPTTSNR